MIARKFSLLRQLLLAAALATGFGTLWALLVLWLGVSIRGGMAGRDQLPPREELVVASDGTPLIASTPWDNQSLATYRDLDGRAQPAPDRTSGSPAMYLVRRRRDLRLRFLAARLGTEALGLHE